MTKFSTGLRGPGVPSSRATSTDWLSLTFLTRSALSSVLTSLTPLVFSSYTHGHSPRREGPGRARVLRCLSPTLPIQATAAPRPHSHHALLTCFEAGIAGKRPQAGSKVWAPRPAPGPTPPRGSPHAAGTPRPRPALPPTKVGGTTPALPSQGGSGPALPPLPAAGGGFPHAPGTAAAGSAALT